MALVSAESPWSAEAELNAAGFVCALAKPFGLAMLRQTLDRIMNQPDKPAELVG